MTRTPEEILNSLPVPEGYREITDAEYFNGLNNNDLTYEFDDGPGRYFREKQPLPIDRPFVGQYDGRLWVWVAHRGGSYWFGGLASSGEYDEIQGDKIEFVADIPQFVEDK